MNEKGRAKVRNWAEYQGLLEGIDELFFEFRSLSTFSSFVSFRFVFLFKEYRCGIQLYKFYGLILRIKFFEVFLRKASVSLASRGVSYHQLSSWRML